MRARRAPRAARHRPSNCRGRPSAAGRAAPRCDPRHASRNARSCDVTRSAPGRCASACLQPLDRGEVQVVGRLVEHQQVDLSDKQACQRGARLLAARQLQSVVVPSRPVRIPGRTAPRRRECRASSPRDARTASRRWAYSADWTPRAPADSSSASRRSICSSSPAPARTAARRVGAATKAGSRFVSWVNRPNSQPALALHLPASGASHPGADAQQRRLARAVGADQAHLVAVGDRRVDRVEDDERADLAAHARQDAGSPWLDASRRAACPWLASVRAAGRRWHQEQKCV